MAVMLRQNNRERIIHSRDCGGCATENQPRAYNPQATPVAVVLLKTNRERIIHRQPLWRLCY